MVIRGHATSISLEPRFWERLRAIAAERNQPLAALVATLDAGRAPGANLSSTLRVFVLEDALARMPASAGTDASGEVAALDAAS